MSIEGNFAKEARLLVTHVYSTRILSGVVIPTLIGVTVGFNAHIISWDLRAFIGILFFLVLFQIWFFILSIRGAAATGLAQTAYLEKKQLDKEIQQLERSLRASAKSIFYLSYVQISNGAWRSMLRSFRNENNWTRDTLAEAIDEITVLVLNQTKRLFGIEQDEMWNLCIYAFDKNKNELFPIWRKKHDSHPSIGMGRRWGVGQGHVGNAFANRQAIITGDAQHEDVAPLINSTSNLAHSNDGETYRSFASIPLGPITKGGSPLGVLVATSNKMGRFDGNNALILKHAAGTITDLLNSISIDLVVLFENNPNNSEEDANGSS